MSHPVRARASLLLALLLCCTAVTAILPQRALPILRSPSTLQITASEPRQSAATSKVSQVIATVTVSFTRLLNGFKAIPSNLQRQQQLKALRKQKGEEAITYSEFMFLQEAAEDVAKIVRAGLFCAVSPEYFFYSYLVIPMMSSASNPWAWRTLPSGFDTEDDKFARDRIVAARRQSAMVTALTVMFSGTAEDVDAKTRLRGGGGARAVRGIGGMRCFPITPYTCWCQPAPSCLQS